MWPTFQAYLVPFIINVPCIPGLFYYRLRNLWPKNADADSLRLNQSLHRYDWDAQKNFVLAFRFYTLETSTHSKITIKKIGASQSYLCKFGSRRLSHISVNGKMASQSYHCKIWFKRLTYISISSTPRVSLISVSIGLVWRRHIRHPPISWLKMVTWQFYELDWFMENLSNQN